METKRLVEQPIDEFEFVWFMLLISAHKLFMRSRKVTICYGVTIHVMNHPCQ